MENNNKAFRILAQPNGDIKNTTYSVYPGFCYDCNEKQPVVHYEQAGQYQCSICGSFETRLWGRKD